MSMEFIIGKYSGFCKGVNYTYNKAKKELESGPLYCLGKLIHNEHVIKELEEKGMKTINSLTEIKDGEKVIFRAHGESKEQYEYAKKHNLKVIDLTCEKVKLIHDKVEKAKNDNFIILFGKKTHPEIIGTKGFAGNNYCIIEDEKDLEELKIKLKDYKNKKLFIISQTTFSNSKFDYLTNIIKDIYKDYEISVEKSICKATENRQKECEEISKKTDYMIIIGSKNSSNTKELYNIACNNCKKVYFVEEIKDLDNIIFKKESSIGIVAGASAPLNLINSIIENLKGINNEI